MILKSFAKILNSVISKITRTNSNIILISGDNVSSGTGVIVLSNCSIVNYAGGNTSSSGSGGTYSLTFNSVSLTFGSGTTEPTADDYQMESPYDTTSHFSWENQVQSYVAANYTKVIAASITNISDENLTVSEIGVILGSSVSADIVLIARSLITPVTIAPNETKTFQYTLDLSGIAG